MNETFRIYWKRKGAKGYRWIEKKGVGELSEFIRNCDAYNRVLISVVNVDEPL